MNPDKFAFLPVFFLVISVNIGAQNGAEADKMSAPPSETSADVSVLPSITLDAGKNTTITFLYKNAKPVDVPQKDYDGLWEIQKEVIDNFIFDLAVFNRNTKSPYGKLPSKGDYYKIGRGTSGDYVNFFMALAREKGLAENLYKVNGKKGRETHVWLEYQTKENAYIIDPAWSDDYPIPALLRPAFKASAAYGRRAFFTTYEEDKIIFDGHQENDHSSYPVKQTEIWFD